MFNSYVSLPEGTHLVLPSAHDHGEKNWQLVLASTPFFSNVFVIKSSQNMISMVVASFKTQSVFLIKPPNLENSMQEVS